MGRTRKFFNDSGILGTFWWQGVPVLWDKNAAPDAVAKKMDTATARSSMASPNGKFSILQELTSSLRESAASFDDDFYSLAKEYDLSVDSSDIELFLTVELSRYQARPNSQEALASNAACESA